MTTVKEFLTRVNGIEGVEGCLLVRADGYLLGHLVDNPERLSSLLTISGKYALDIMEKAGFSYFRFLSFERGGGYNLHMFPVDKYFLGVVQVPDFPLYKMIEKVSRLLSLVKTSSSKDKKDQTNREGSDGAGL